ncbi:MAG: hypothetical protein ACYCSW_05265 [bacterium]
MNGDMISIFHHVARYCKPTQVLRNPDTMEAETIDVGNFQIRNNEKGISVNWVEKHAKPTVKEALISIKERMKSYPYKISNDGVFVVAKVEHIINIGKKHSVKLSVIENPIKKDNSHALILGIEANNYSLQQDIALNVNIYSI